MASEPKTKPTDASVEAFLDAVEHPGRREDGKAVAKLLTEVSGEKPVIWGSSIVGYGSYKGPTGDWPIIGFSPRKANLVLYFSKGFEGADALVEKLGKVKKSVGCLYVNRLSDLDQDVLRELAVQSVRHMREAYPAS